MIGQQRSRLLGQLLRGMHGAAKALLVLTWNNVDCSSNHMERENAELVQPNSKCTLGYAWIGMKPTLFRPISCPRGPTPIHDPTSWNVAHPRWNERAGTTQFSPENTPIRKSIPQKKEQGPDRDQIQASTSMIQPRMAAPTIIDASPNNANRMLNPLSVRKN